MDILAVAGDLTERAVGFFAAAGGEEGGGTAGGGEEGGFQINLFWVVAQATTFLLFFVILYLVAFRRIGSTLEGRRARIEQGLRDADAARREREQAEQQRQALLAEARREANEIAARAQRAADEVREREMAATRADLERLREQAVNEIQVERQRALADIRSQVADLAILAAGRVVGETMSGPRERRLVDEFLAQMPTDGADRR